MFWTIHQQIKSKILVQNICSGFKFNVFIFFPLKLSELQEYSQKRYNTECKGKRSLSLAFSRHKSKVPPTAQATS